MNIIAAMTQVLAVLDAWGMSFPGLPNPDPEYPTNNITGIRTLLGYIKWGAILACGIAALVSGGMMAAGSLSSRPDSVDKGKRALLWSLGGLIVVSLAIPMVNNVFGSVS